MSAKLYANPGRRVFVQPRITLSPSAPCQFIADFIPFFAGKVLKIHKPPQGREVAILAMTILLD
jgi:hypothetical protein